MPQLLFDCERMKYPNTGLYTFCDELGSALLAEQQADEKLFFYLPHKLGNHFGEQAGYIWQKSLHKFYLPHKEQMDVWHTPYQSSPYRSRKKGTRKVVTIHDLNFLHEGKSPDKVKKHMAAVQRNIDQADVLTAISGFAQAEVLRHLNTHNKPFHVIYNGASVKEFPGFDQPRYRPDTPFFFALGTVLPKKNFHVLPCLLEKSDAQLVVAGNVNVDYRERINEAARKHGVENRVKIIGPISPEEKYWYYKHCDAFLFPSLAEGFGLPAIEAMHFGKPVFLSDKTSLPEIGGNAAYYFHDFDPSSMRNTLQEGLQHYADTQPGEKIRQHAAQFNWQHAAREYWKVYRSLL